MKKLIAAAVASSMTAFAMADIAITGNAKYEYDHTDNAGTTTNTANTEVNLFVKGKSGDTSVVANLELNTHGGADEAGRLDIEDLYMTTKVGDVSVKAGNYASGTSAHLGEIDNGSRGNDKVTLTYSMGDIDIYAGSNGVAAAEENSTVSENMFYGAVIKNVMGNTINVKHHSETQDSFGIKGSMAGVNYRYEATDKDGSGDAYYGELTTKVGELTLGYATLDADVASLLAEDDSSLFALSTGDFSTATGQDQVMLSTAVDGTTFTVKMGTMEKGISSSVDKDYSQVKASRKLASGATAVITFTDEDVSGGSKENMEIELNVAF